MRRRLAELVDPVYDFFFFFLASSLIAQLKQRNPHTASRLSRFFDVATGAEFWQYMEGPFISGMFDPTASAPDVEKTDEEPGTP